MKVYPVTEDELNLLIWGFPWTRLAIVRRIRAESFADGPMKGHAPAESLTRDAPKTPERTAA